MWLSYLIDGWIILIGALVAINAIIQLVIELKVKDQEGKISYSRIKITKHLLFLIIGMVIVVMRVIYIIE